MTWQPKSLLALIDLLLIIAAIYLALLMRFEGDIPLQYFQEVRIPYIIIPILTLTSLYIFGLYNRVWRYAGLDIVFSLFQALTASFGLAAIPVFITGGNFYPRGVLIITWLLTFFLLGGIRLFLRLVSQGSGRILQTKRVLILGANDVGESVLREILRHPASGYYAAGFIDDDPKKHNMRIHGVSVLGGKEMLPELVHTLNISELILALPKVSPKIVKDILTIAEPLRITLKTVPGVEELINGKITINTIRHVEIEDLLEREQVNADLTSIAAFLKNKRILITGAGGSIGSEIARQIMRFNPEILLLLGRGENSIYEVLVELAKSDTAKLIPIIADICDTEKIVHILSKYKPHIVFHAAAHKHVPFMESHVREAVHNNALATWNLAKESMKQNVETFIFLSTDKAVNSKSVMGATKRVGELIVKGLASQNTATKFIAVRFGNVLNSRGSVIPTFKKQIAMGGPVTVTDPNMTRFFMTIPEAVMLVLEAAALGKGGEIFVLDMGRPIRILDLARHLITLSGFEPDKDIPIIFLGSRPGEKEEERLVHDFEQMLPTTYEKIFKVEDSRNIAFDTFKNDLEELDKARRRMDEALMKLLLKKIIPEYLLNSEVGV